jgi:hypothetical protein
MRHQLLPRYHPHTLSCHYNGYERHCLHAWRWEFFSKVGTVIGYLVQEKVVEYWASDKTSVDSIPIKAPLKHDCVGLSFLWAVGKTLTLRLLHIYLSNGIFAPDSDYKIDLAILFPYMNGSKDCAQRIEFLLQSKLSNQWWSLRCQHNGRPYFWR